MAVSLKNTFKNTNINNYVYVNKMGQVTPGSMYISHCFGKAEPNPAFAVFSGWDSGQAVTLLSLNQKFNMAEGLQKRLQTELEKYKGVQKGIASHFIFKCIYLIFTKKVIICAFIRPVRFNAMAISE